MKGRFKRLFCGVLATAMVAATPMAAMAETINIGGLEIERVEAEPVVAENSKINTKTKRVTLYAGLTYTFRGNGFKRAKADWKISNTKYATLKVGKTGAATVTTKKAGNFTITAKQGSRKYTYRVTVKEDFTKKFLDTKAKKNLVTWDKMEGADGYLVVLEYHPENYSGENGWKAGDIMVQDDLKDSDITQFDMKKIENWEYYRSCNWFLRVKPYQISGDEVVFASEYPEDMTFNTVKLK